MTLSLLNHIPGGATLQHPEDYAPPKDPAAVATLKQRIFDGLLPGQLAVCKDDTHRMVGYVAGLGAGKSYCLAAWCTLMALCNPGTIAAAFAPTGPLVRDVLQQSLEDYWNQMNIPFIYRASPLPQYRLRLPNGNVTIKCRSMESWSRIIGMNLSFIAVDEIDTVKRSIARLAVDRFLGRLRAGSRRALGMFSTPEGFGLLHALFVEAGDRPDRALYRGRTADNPHLPPDYLQGLLDNYPPNLVKAYTEGEFCRMETAGVYPDFNRAVNCDTIIVDDDDIIYCGVDFNVDRCALVFMVVRKDRTGQKSYYVVNELYARDTIACIETIKSNYAQEIKENRLVVCPDASAKNRSAQDASQSSIGLMKRAGLRLKYEPANPRIADRVLSVNVLICNGNGERHLHVHPSCKQLIKALEQQAYDLKTQQPEKGDGGIDDLSGPTDALGYAIHQLAGITPWKAGKSRMRLS